jgi:serine/threonine-protein kinase RsbW
MHKWLLKGNLVETAYLKRKSCTSLRCKITGLGLCPGGTRGGTPLSKDFSPGTYPIPLFPPPETHVADSNPRVRVSSDEPRRILLQGLLDYQDAPDIRRYADVLLKSGVSPLRVDARRLQFMDSSGLSALVYAAREAQKMGASLCLIGANEQLQRLLHVTGIELLFHLEDATAEHPCEEEPVLDLLPGEIAFELPCNPGAMPLAREKVGAFLHGRGFSSSARSDIFLALGEGLANAIRHGCPKASPKTRIRVRAAFDGEQLILQITDPGPGFDPNLIPLPDVSLLKEGGMGLFFMKSVMDTLTYQQDERGHTATMTKRIG